MRDGLCALAAWWLLVLPAHAQSDQQSAAEAYDQGAAAYLAQDYEKAAEWFESANRLSPAAPALIQAARAHQQAGHRARAATLGLRLTQEYADDSSATSAGQTLLDELAGKLVRVDITCEGCAAAVDGVPQESLSFFVDPNVSHEVAARFEAGDQSSQVNGQPGETKSLEFSQPGPRPAGYTPSPSSWSGSAEPRTDSDEAESRKPLSPVYTIIGASLTGVLLVGSILSTVDMNAGVDPYETAAKEYRDCADTMGDAACGDAYDDAKQMLDDGKSKETRSTVLWAATGGVAVITGVIALFFTDWSGDSEDTSEAHAMQFQLAPSAQGASLQVKGSL